MKEWLDQRDIHRIARNDPSLKSVRSGFGDAPPVGRFECIPVEDGLFCSINEWRTREAMEDRLIIRNSVGLQFVQTGKVTQSLKGSKRYIHSGARVCLTTYPGEVRQQRRYGVDLEVKYLGAWIDPDLLIDKFGLSPDQMNEGLRGFFTGDAHDPFCTSFPLPPRLWLALDEMFANRYTGKLRETYLSSKINELICETVATLGNRDFAANSNHQSLSLRTRMAVDTASLIYMQELHAPPTLDELAARVGMNRNKLNEGFQQIFGCSPHTYSKRIRMDWARRLLIDGVMETQEIGHAVGYSTQSAFSRAFSDHFGFPPSQAIECLPHDDPSTTSVEG